MIKVSSLRVNDVPDSLFRLAIASGEMVIDSTLLPPKDGKIESVSYVMPAAPEQVDAAVEKALDERSRRRSERSFRTWLIVFGVGLPAAAALLALGRRLIKRGQRNARGQ